MLHVDMGNSKVTVNTEIKFSCVKLLLMACEILSVGVTKKIRFPFEAGLQTLKRVNYVEKDSYGEFFIPVYKENVATYRSIL